MWEQLRWVRLIPVGNRWYTSVDAATGAIPVCSPARTLSVGTSWDHTGIIGNRWYAARMPGSLAA